MGELHRHNNEQKKPDTKRTYYMIPFISSSRTAKLTYGDRCQNSSYLSVQAGGGVRYCLERDSRPLLGL